MNAANGAAFRQELSAWKAGQRACPTKKADRPGGHNRLKPVPPWTGQEACPTKIMSLAGRASLLGRRPTPDCPPRSACSVARPVLCTPLTVLPDRARVDLGDRYLAQNAIHGAFDGRLQ